MDRRSLDLFVKILLEIDEIEARKAEFHIDAELWSHSRPMRDLLLMPLIQIGELVAHFKGNEQMVLFPGVPWRDIKGFRNVVVHGYGYIDADSAWETATRGISELRSELLDNQEVCTAYQQEIECRDKLDGDSNADDLNSFLDSLPLAD